MDKLLNSPWTFVAILALVLTFVGMGHAITTKNCIINRMEAGYRHNAEKACEDPDVRYVYGDARYK